VKLSGIEGQRGDPAVNGHPALLDVKPAFELGPMPQGGGYPQGFIELAARLMGCADVDQVVHLCSGSVRARRTFDYRAAAHPAVVADVRWLPIGRGRVRWIMADPPYSEDHAEELWALGKKYPTPIVLLRECAEALMAGGRVAFLHFLVPYLPDDLTRIGTWGVSIGPGFRMRALTVAEKSGAQRIPFDAAYEGCPTHGLECEHFAMPAAELAAIRQQAVAESTTLVHVDPTERSAPDAPPHA
jgi:hypothetical protein